MGGFFKFDGPFYRFGSMLADVMILSLLWIICSIPLVTIGASTTAAYYAMTKRVTGAENAVTRDFFSSFRKEFLKATAAWLVSLAVIMLVFWAVQGMNAIVSQQDVGALQYVFQAVVFVDLIETVFVILYLFPILSRFDLKFGAMFKTAFFMANKHIPTTIMCVLIMAFISMLVYWSGFLLLLAPGIYVFLSSYFFVRLFGKYRPEIAKDPNAIEEELAPLNLGDDDKPADGGDQNA